MVLAVEDDVFCDDSSSMSPSDLFRLMSPGSLLPLWPREHNSDLSSHLENEPGAWKSEHVQYESICAYPIPFWVWFRNTSGYATIGVTSSGRNIGLSRRYWFIIGFNWRIPVFMSSLSNVSGSGNFGSNGFVFSTDRSRASISTTMPVLSPWASFIRPLPDSWLNSALKRVAGSLVSLVGRQVASSSPLGILMSRTPFWLKISRHCRNCVHLFDWNSPVDMVSPHIQHRGRVVDGPVNLRVQHRGVAVVLRGVGHAGVPHDCVEEVSRQPHSCDITSKLLMIWEGWGAGAGS